MFNLFKKKKPWIRFYSVSPGVAQLNPWIPASKVKRKWTKDALKKFYGKESKCPASTVRKMWNHYNAKMSGEPEGEKYDGLFQHAVTCPAIQKMMHTGWVVTAPADFIVKTVGDGEDFGWLSQVMFDTGGPTYVKAHVSEQTEGMRQTVVPAPYRLLDTTIKLELPWRVQAHKDIVFLQIPVPYYEDDRFTVPTGIVDPSYSYEVNMQLFWHTEVDREEKEYLIQAGTPLAQWIPFDRKYLDNSGIDVIIEDANEEDTKNNKVMDYNRHMHFTEMTSLNERIDRQKEILALNKNKERFE
tara:strand:- start:4459 stop:5355 length:897 start_codon:yes stop_codon:yes gene_type:complete